MSPPTSSPKAAPLRRRGWTELFHQWYHGTYRAKTSSRFRVWWLLGLLLNFAALGVAAYWIGFTRPAAPHVDRHIAVPYSANAALWEPLHRWIIQEDGRLKPFETFCMESVRTITGRARFENNDPVAVAASWLFLHDSDGAQASQAAAVDPDWDRYPFILCDDRDLRAAVYRDYRGADAELSDEDRNGKYIEPIVLRYSKAFQKLVRSGADKEEKDAKTPLTRLETRAAEVKKRLGLYDRICAGGQEGRERDPRAGRVRRRRAGSTRGHVVLTTQCARSSPTSPGVGRNDGRAPAGEPHPLRRRTVQELPTADIAAIRHAQWQVGEAYRSGSDEKLGAALGSFIDTVNGINARVGEVASSVVVDRELWFNHVNPFRQAWIASLAAVVFLGISLGLGQGSVGRGLYALGLVGYVGCMSWAAVGLWCRMTISGRPPVSNMYESIIWVAFMAAAFSLALEAVYRRRAIALAGAIVSTLGFILADQLPLTFPPNIQPLQAVLRSNYWLVIHVLVIVSSYPAFALAWALGNLTLGVLLFAPHRKDLAASLARFCYRAIQIGVVLLAAGTFLGGFWAAESWGRFWGWDPKEVWALIALLCYIIPLHARYVGWIGEFGLSVCAVVCFAAVMMAWYGVNFVLGAGLHSYGFGGADDAWVYWAGCAQSQPRPARGAEVPHDEGMYWLGATLRFCPRRAGSRFQDTEGRGFGFVALHPPRTPALQQIDASEREQIAVSSPIRFPLEPRNELVDVSPCGIGVWDESFPDPRTPPPAPGKPSPLALPLQ